MVDEAAGDKEKLAQDQSRLTLLRQRYAEFSKAAGLRTQEERAEVAGFGEKAGVANRAKSGITRPNVSKEKPEMTGTPTPTPKPPAKTTVKATAEDVTEEYFRNAAPGQGTVTHEDGYKISGHRDEIDMADWIHRTFGGDIKLLKESTVKNQETPDYLWKLKMWELKGTTSINGADKRLQHAIKQIQDNPGGVILNITEDVDMDELEKQLLRRFLRGGVDAFDLMLLSNSKLVKVLRYKK